MLKLIVLFLFPSFCLAYPEVISKSCASCHSESSGSGILTTEREYKIETPAWLLLGAKADLKQTFTKTPYTNEGSFKATRAEAQVGLNTAIDTYLNFSAQGSVNRVEPKTKSDSISDYMYSPYRYLELQYSDTKDESLAIKHGYYRNEWQSDLQSLETSFSQTELTYLKENHQLSFGYISKIKTYNTTSSMDDVFINYKFLKTDRYSFLLAHQWRSHYQLTSLGFVVKKSENLSLKMILAQTVNSGIKGVRGRLMPFYQFNSAVKFYGFADYQNTNIKIAKPRKIIYGAGLDYLWLTQAMLSAVYSKTDDSAEVNNPTQKVEFNFHLYM